jgi:3',5'-cyclic AMP phosphodiesterase CpdA
MPIHLPPLTRRRFLAGALAGAGVLLNRPAFCADTPTDPNRWVLLSDLHIWERRNGERRGVKPAEHLAQAVKEVLALAPRPVGIIVSGDCAYLTGERADYAVLADLIKPLREAGIPLHMVLGNHDHRENFWAAFPETKPQQPQVSDKSVAVVETGHANWFLLDSLEKTDATPGLLGKEQLEWLAKALSARADKPALVVGHHNLAGPAGLRDAEDLLKLIADHKQVKAYVYGHTHQWGVVRQRGIHFVNVPTTAWVFAKEQPQGWVDVTLRKEGATLVHNALDKQHPKHGERVELSWNQADAPAKPAAAKAGA